MKGSQDLAARTELLPVQTLTLSLTSNFSLAIAAASQPQ
jgi:hypothetical protein